MLEIKNVTKWFKGVHALSDVSVAFNEGTIHGVVGENGAGKSTLMKIISGVYSADSGEIYLNGELCNFQSPREAYDRGIRFVHQELSLIESLSVAENLYIHRFRNQKVLKLARRKQLCEEAKAILDFWKIDVDPAKKVSDISISMRQMVEIARELSTEGKIIILDEPTSSLTENEIEKFFEFLRDLRSKNYIVIFISHRINEILNLVDRITVLRDGELIGTRDTEEMNPDEIVHMIANKQLSELFPKSLVPIGDTVFEVENMTGPGCEDINFSVRKGEILGLAGLVGAGRSETLKTIFGLIPKASGRITFNGKEIDVQRPDQAISLDIMMLSENRGAEGIFPLLNIAKNTIILRLKDVCKLIFLNKKLIDRRTREGVDSLGIVTFDPYRQLISQLSGGNQQKVIFARLLGAYPKLLLLDEPTRGIDVNNKSEIHKIIGRFLEQGGSVVMVSSELDEIFGVCDRVVVLFEGKQVALFDRDSFDKEEVLRCMMGVQSRTS